MSICNERKSVNKLIAVVMLTVVSVSCVGCSAIMAIKQPGKVNLGVLNSGTSRDNVITHLGAPISSEVKDDKRVEIYQFTQGYSGGIKATRATCYVIADVFTFFIWELIGIPAELIANGNKMTVKVNYAEDKVLDFVYLAQPS